MTLATRTRQRNLRHGLGAIAALVAALVGIPVLLVTLGHALIDSPNPFHGATPPWRWNIHQVSHVLTRALDNRTIIATISRTGLALAWSAFAIVIASILVELRSLRLHGIPASRIRGLAWSQAIARRVAAGLLSLSTVLPAHVASAAPLTARPAATAPLSTAATPARTPAPTSVPLRTNDRWTTYHVVRGDSIYGIAGRLAEGDRTRTREIAQLILDRNLGHTMNDGRRFTTPGVILQGWMLDVPGVPPAAPVTEPTPPVAQPSSPGSGDTYTVRPGDSYWAISEHHLEIVLGREPSPREVLAETLQLEDLNADHLGRRTPATLLVPGDELVLTPSAEPTVPLPEPVPSTAPTAAPSPAPTVQPTATVPPPTVLVPPTVAPLPAPAEPTSSGPTSTVLAPPPPTTLSTVSGADRSSADDEHPVPPANNPWTDLAIGTLLATGVAATITKLRRRRLARRRPGTRVRPIPAEAAMTETVLRSEARPDRVATLHELLSGLRRTARLDGDRPLVRAAQLDDEGVELLWSQPQPSPPHRWTTTDGGWSWRIAWPSPAAASRDQVPVLPTLVTIGTRDDGAELLLDLEAAGSVAVDGPDELVGAFLRQVALTLATSPLAENIDLISTDLDVPGETQLERLRTATAESASTWLATRSEETRVGLGKAKVSTTLGARLLGRDRDEWEPIVVFAAHADSQLAECLSASSPPGIGSASVLGGASTANERIVLHGPDRAEWISMSLTFRPHLLPASAADAVNDLLDHVAEAPEEQVTLADSPIQLAAIQRPDSETGEDPAATPSRCYDVLVRVLGEVTVEGCPEHLTDAEVELLALLATVRPDGPINIDRLATLLAHDEWRTPQLRTIQARISHLRRKLGVGTDGAPLLPDSRAATGSPSRYLISPRVVTDVDLLDHASRLAGGLPSGEAQRMLRGAMELVTGRPYTAPTGYSWAYDEHAASRAVQVVGDVAAQLVELFGEAGDPSGIRWTVDRASRSVDDPMTELPYRLAERRWAEDLPSADLRESVRAHANRLAAFVDEEDPASG